MARPSCESAHLLLCLLQADRAVPHVLGQPALVVVLLAPLIHVGQHSLWVVDDNLWALQV